MSTPFMEGERVTLTGTLGAAGPARASFEDARRAVAAATARGTTGSVDVRAERLWIEVDGRRVEIAGPVMVAVGSIESRPGAPLSDLSQGVLQRVAEASGAAPMPRGDMLFRSLSPGDRVRARGVLTRGAAGGAIAYREEAAPWSLAPDPDDEEAFAPAIRLSFEGRPRVRGPIACIARGVRTARRAAVAALIVGSIVAGGLVLSSVKEHAHVIPKPGKPVAHFAGYEGCKKLKAAYVAERDRESRCERDEDCVVEMRGEQWSELDGCFRFRNKDSSPAPADKLAKAWLDASCVSALDLCTEEPQAVCREGQCVERPPSNLPASWVRHDIHHVFSLFLPPDYWVTFPPHDDVLLYTVFTSQRNNVVGSLSYEPCDFDCLPSTEGEPLKIHGQDAFLKKKYDKTETLYIVSFPDPPPCTGGLFCPGHKNWLSVHIRCEDRAECEAMMPALQSIRFY